MHRRQPKSQNHAVPADIKAGKFAAGSISSFNTVGAGFTSSYSLWLRRGGGWWHILSRQICKHLFKSSPCPGELTAQSWGRDATSPVQAVPPRPQAALGWFAVP